MKIAVDYDGTYSEDPDLWYGFMCDARVAGHEVFVVTFRDDRFDVNDDLLFLEEDDFDVYYTRGVAKRWWCNQFGPGKVCVWIDDKPEAILYNSEFGTEDLAVWRAGNEQAA